MTFDFDQVFDRHDTGSTKWSRYPADVLPMWVADMDFAAPPRWYSRHRTWSCKCRTTRPCVTRQAIGA